MLTRLKLTNFQKHEALDIEFANGLTLIVGDNWTGKTTVLRGVLYCLFGSSIVDVKAGDLVAKGKKGFQATLEFMLQDKPYTVTRSKMSATLKQGDKTIATSHTDVNKEIESLLGVSGRNFKLLNASQQGDVNSILYLNSATINEIVNEITGVTLVDDALQRCREEANRTGWAEAAAEGLKSRLELDVTALYKQQQQLNGVTAWLQQTETQYASVKAEVQAKEDALAALEREYLATRSASMRREKLLGYAEQLTDQIVTLQQQQADFNEPSYLALSEKFDQANENINRRTYLTRTIKDRQADVTAAKRSVETLTEKLGTTKMLLKDCDDRQVLAHEETARSALEQARERSRTLASLLKDAVCEACGTQLKDIDRPALIKEMEENEARLPKLTATWQGLRDAVDEQRKLESALPTLEQQLDDWTDRFTAASSLLEKLQEELTHLLSERDVLDIRKRYADAKTQYDLFLLAKQQLVGKKEELQNVQDELSTLTSFGRLVSDEEILQAREQARESRTVADQWSEAIHEQEKAHASLSQSVRHLSEQVERQEQQLQEAESQRTVYRAHRELEKFLKKNREAYMAEIWTRLLSYASQFISDATQGGITEISRAESGRFAYLEKGERMPVELASGMQQAILGLGLKLALGAAIGAGRRLLILDEVTAAASDSNSLMLCSLLAKYPGQVLMVSHRDADAAVADAVVSLG